MRAMFTGLLIAAFFVSACQLDVNRQKDAEKLSRAGPELSHDRTPEQTGAQKHRVWHTVTLDFQSAETSEGAKLNPFLNFRLDTRFTHESGASYEIRGFYAADGHAAQTGADSGGVWRVRFSPPLEGRWRYSAQLVQGTNVALNLTQDSRLVDIQNAQGSFNVYASDKSAPDFRADKRGRLIAKNGYFVFEDSNKVWLKGGTNSPENFLAFEGIDQTYRVDNQARAGEAAAKDKRIHRYETHKSEYKHGDPTWHGGNSDGIIGAVNYLASQGMNSIYMLTMNLNGDGQDVWPFASPDVFNRFDVSKLAQWNLVFEHMQSRGMMVHIVLQETENELLLDEGDMGPLRQLYFQEMIARFGHLPALVWNLGEENGPIHWRPEGQSDQQRRDMARFIKTNDPYNHPVIIHTHAGAKDKDEMYGPLIGYQPLDGLSFQIADRQTVFSETRRWRKNSIEAGQPWLLTMDEIGVWHTGAVPDDMTDGHRSLRRHVLWGHFLAGGAGVEWYFGAHYPQNDLGLEDFSSREQLWQQTRHALNFFERHTPLGKLDACPENLIDRTDAYCAAYNEDLFVLYLPESSNAMFNLPSQNYTISWFDPVEGGPLQRGGKDVALGQDWMNLGMAPKEDGRDWVLLLKAE